MIENLIHSEEPFTLAILGTEFTILMYLCGRDQMFQIWNPPIFHRVEIVAVLQSLTQY